MAKIEITIPDWLDKICTWPVLAYRKHKFGYPFRRIPLGEGKFTIVDPQDYYWLNDFHWTAKQNGPRTYAVRLISDSRNRTKILSMHREIFFNCSPACPELAERAQLSTFSRGFLVDHKSRNTLDNRLENLRLATHSQNQCNKEKTARITSSRFIGVFFEKSSGKWIARISVNGKRIWLGRFDTEIEAAKAYDEAARKYHKEFARLNFPEEAPVS